VTDDASVEAAMGLVAKTGGLDVLINNAGISDRTPVVETAAADVLRVDYVLHRNQSRLLAPISG
jgi:NAD(P)-dependent dehydrogenase (short-subunit alcohol dehydrogenase family)